MSQDQGPTQEPRISEVEQATNAHNMAELTAKTDKLHPDVRIAINNAGFDLEYLMRKWKGKKDSWGELKGKRVLDLASGSAIAKPNWNPYFARLCAFNGADVTTVDKLPQIGHDAELFHGITVDIVKAVMEKTLGEKIGDGNFDVVHSYSFIGNNPSPELTDWLRVLHVREEDFRKGFFEQSLNLLAEGGIMYLDERDYVINKDIYYTKKGGKPVRI